MKKEKEKLKNQQKIMSTQHRNMSYLLNVKIQNIKTFKRSKKIEDLNKRFRPSN